MFEAYPPLSPHDPRFPHDPHFGYFGSAPLPPWPVLSTVGQGPKGDGIVIKAKVDKNGHEYLEFWSTNPDDTEPLWISPTFPERHSDDPDDPSSYTSLAKRVGAIRQVMPYATALIQRFLWTRDGLSRTHTYGFRWNTKYVEPHYPFETDSSYLRMNLGQNMGYGIQLVGAVHQVPDPNHSQFDPNHPTWQDGKIDVDGNWVTYSTSLDCTSVDTPGSIVEPTDAGLKNQRVRIEDFLNEYYTTHPATDVPTPREIAQAASVILPWSYPDGYIMYPLVTMNPTDVNSNKRYSTLRGLSVRPAAYGTDVIGIYLPSELNDGTSHFVRAFNDRPSGADYDSIYNPYNRLYVAANPRRRSLIRKDYLYLQKNYYSPDHDVSVVLPFGLSGWTVTHGTSKQYYGRLWFDSAGADEASHYAPDSRVIVFSDKKVLGAGVGEKCPWFPAHRIPYDVSRKAARVMVEFCMGNGRGLYYDSANGGQPYIDPVYNEYVLNPDAWRLAYNQTNSGWHTAADSKNYYQAADRMIDWRQDHDVSPMLRGLFFYSRDNSAQFRMFPVPRPKNLSQADLINVLAGQNTANTQAYYLRTMGADCSSTVALAYFAPVDAYGFNKSEDNQFWIPNLAGAAGVCGDLVSAAAPGVPLDLSQAKPGDLIMVNKVYSNGERIQNQSYTNHVAMVVSTPSDPMISSADLLDLHYPVYDVPDYENPNAATDYDHNIKFFKHLTMDDVRNKVIVMHTSSSHDATGHEMYKDSNGDWQFVNQADRPPYPTMNPVIIANNDAEHWQQYQSFRYLVRWSYENADSATAGDNMRNNDPTTYIYRWIMKLVELVENDEIDLFPSWDEEAAAQFDFGGLPDDGDDESDTVEDPNQSQQQPVLSDVRGDDMRRGPRIIDDSTWYEYDEVEGTNGENE